jgi:hypothetical protein
MVNNIKGLQVVNWIGDREGIFQAIVKVPAGFMIATEIGSEVPLLIDGRKELYRLSSLKVKGLTIGQQYLLRKELKWFL